MSVIKNKATKYHTTAQDVKYKLSVVQLTNVHDKPSIVIACQLRGTVDGTDGEIELVPANLTIDDVTANFSASEKGAAKTFLKAVEREAVLKIDELKTEPHDGSDVFA